MPTTSALGAACGLFVSTNVDQLVLLVAWSADPRLSFRRILAGHLLGIGSLVCVSLLVAAGVADVSPAGVRLIGLVPLCLGLVKLRQAWLAESRARPSARVIQREHFDRSERRRPRLASGALTIALLTIASGGDNVAAYVPVFRAPGAPLATDAAVFGAMSLLWCATARALVHQRRLRPWIVRASPWLTPVVLLVLGLGLVSGVRTAVGPP
jgi:cadmium resistance protein CadD (predicted permease)